MAKLSPYRVELALRTLIRDIDYDTHKQLDSDEETGESSYPDLAREFIESYEGATS